MQIVDDHGVPIADTAHPALAKVADTELIGPDSKPTDTLGQAHSIEIPLERQISFKFPTVITPSEQAEDVRHIQTAENGIEQVLTAKQAAKAYAGELLLLLLLLVSLQDSICMMTQTTQRFLTKTHENKRLSFALIVASS